MSEEKPLAPTRVPAWTRAFVAVFLAAFIVCGVGGIELWPLTGWRLFSVSRQRLDVGWSAMTVDMRGREAPLPLGRMPISYRGAALLVGRFARMKDADREALCEVLVAGANRVGARAVSLRIYRVEVDHSIRSGKRPAAPLSMLAYQCGNGRVVSLQT